ncbi:hypothetical protein Q5752_001166 [Cryptotrichosporon argae]
MSSPTDKPSVQHEAVAEIEGGAAGKHVAQHVETGPHGDEKHGHDLAVDLIRKAGGRIDFPEEEGERVRWKIDKRLMPLMIGIYFMQFFDKQGLSFASTYGLQTQVPMHGTQYSWTGSIVYVAWICANPIGAYLLVRVPIRYLVPFLVCTWGIIMMSSAAVTTWAGLMVARFILGMMEALIAPSFIYIGQSWYRRAEQPFRIAMWYIQNATVAIFGSLIAWGFGHIVTTKLHYYQILWIFLGSITFLWSIVVALYFPESPANNNFLTEDEKLIAVERLRANQQGTKSYDFKLKQALGTFLDIKTYIWVGLLTLISIPSGGISTFGPLILEGFGFSGSTVLLFQMPFGFVQGVAILLSFWASKRFKSKSVVILALMVPCLVGSGLLYGLGRGASDQAGLLVGYYILAFYTPITPLIMSWYASNTAGSSRRTSTIAVATIGQAAGNIGGPLLFSSTDAPYYHPGLRDILIIFCIFTGLVLFAVFWLFTLNKRNERRRVADGKPAKMPDFSMMTAAEAEAAKREMAAERAARLGTDPDAHEFQYGEHAFDDMTDLENNEFVYVY